MSVPGASVRVMTGRERLVVAPFGPGATAALSEAIRDAQAGDPLAAVDVVVPTPIAGLSVRRAVAGGGLANVRFSSLPQLAQRLAARHLALTGRRPVRPADRALAARVALRSTSGPLSASAARHHATADILEGLFAELDDVDASRPGFLDLLAAGSRSTLDTVQVYRAYRVQLAAAAPEATAPADAAIAALEAGDAPDTHVILYAPQQLLPGDRRFLAALARRDRLTSIICRNDDDEAGEMLAWLSSHLGEPVRRGHVSAPDVRIVVAPDAEEEARLAVRTVMARVEAHPVRPERIAIAYRNADPYLRTLVQVLEEAGLPFSAPADTTLAQTAAGRLLTGLLDLRAEGYPRSDVIRWLSDAPVLDGAGRPVPAARWDKVSRDARVSRGAPSWRKSLDRFAASHALEAPDEQRRREVADAEALASMVDEIQTTAERVASASTWREVSAAMHAAVLRFLGTGGTVARWHAAPDAPPHAQRRVRIEEQAYDSVLAAVDGLTLLDRTASPPDPETVRVSLARELDRPTTTGTTLGRGVLVAPISQFAGSDLDLLLVLGMTEDAYPPRLREHPVLRDVDRALVGVPTDGSALRTTAHRRAAERSHHAAALAGARHVVLSYPVADVRGQRRQFPSPWLLEEASRLAGEPVVAERLPTWPGGPWLSVQPSFEASLRTATTAASRYELDVALAHGGTADRIADPRFQRGREGSAARSRAEFGPWLGGLPPLDEALLARAGATRSATTLEGWATCPASYLFRRLLRVGELEDVGDQDRIDQRARGSLVHRALERFLAGHLPSAGRGPRDPDAAWTPAEIREAAAILDEEAALLEQSGATGRPALWRADLARLHRVLADVLVTDSALRRARRSWPVAVEMTFGRDGTEPLRLTLADGRAIEFAGSADRVDLTQDGRLYVLDYKTGKGYGYDEIPRLGEVKPDADLTDRGRKIQLSLYALAAEASFGQPPEAPTAADDAGATATATAATLAYYWFVEQGRLLRGGPIDDRQRDRLRHVLGVATESIEQGVFPANPGEWSAWSGHSSCGFCPYDRVCSTNRGEIWDRLRSSTGVAAYAALADGSDAVTTEPAGAVEVNRLEVNGKEQP